VRGQKGIAREITLDLEDTGEYGQETLELAALYGGGSVIHGLKALRQRSPIEDQLCAQGGGADTPDSQQKLIDRILRKLSPEDRNVLVRVFGLIDGKEHSDAELGEVLKVSKATAGRKRHRAVARGRAEILLSEQKLAELTGTTVPSQQMAVLRSLEVLHEPPKPWQLGSRDDSGRRTVTERGVKPIVVWLSDVRYLMRPERVEQLEKKLTQLLSTLLTSHVPPWLEDAYGTAVNTVGQALQCLARIREGKFKL
jgi:hypothetical protein